MADAEALFREALLLEHKERAELIDKLLSSLAEIDTEIDALWVRKAEDRIEAYEPGRMQAVSLEEVLRKYR